jgi:hypothetical protein
MILTIITALNNNFICTQENYTLLFFPKIPGMPADCTKGCEFWVQQMERRFRRFIWIHADYYFWVCPGVYRSNRVILTSKLFFLFSKSPRLLVSHSLLFSALFISVRKMKPERLETKTVWASCASEFFCFREGEFSERPEMNSALILWLLSHQGESNV